VVQYEDPMRQHPRAAKNQYTHGPAKRSAKSFTNRAVCSAIWSPMQAGVTLYQGPGNQVAATNSATSPNPSGAYPCTYRGVISILRWPRPAVHAAADLHSGLGGFNVQCFPRNIGIFFTRIGRNVVR